MNVLRNSLIGAIVVVAFLLFLRWNDFQEQHYAENNKPEETISTEIDLLAEDVSIPEPQAQPNVSNSDISDLAEVPEVTPKTSVKSATHSQLVNIKTDVFNILIDTSGGDIVKVALFEYLAEEDQPDNPFILLDRTKSHVYIAQSGLVGPNGTDKKGSRPLFTAEKGLYEMHENQDSLVVDLFLQQDSVNITKRFTFTKSSYLIDVEYLIDNQSDQPWTATLFGQIKRDNYKPSSDMIGMQPFVGAAITTPEEKYKKFSLGDLEDETFKITHQGGWVAMIQHYFVSAWIPNPESNNAYNLRKSSNKEMNLLGFTSDLITVPSQGNGSLKASFYAGPKIIKNLEKISPYLDLTIDFSWLWFIAKPLFIALDFIHSHVGNWGIAIILLTFAIKVLFLYPSAMSYRSMAKMRKLQPMMTELKDRFGDDRQKMSAELMKLYKKEKVNPLGGCLPILLQMPVFIALYWALMESVELRHSPFYLWITDLSVKDPYFILPIIMGATMYIQQKLNPTPPDPMQAKIMQMMPIFFTFLFLMFPAGLVLYWVCNNTLSIIQQYAITRQIEKQSS